MALADRFRAIEAQLPDGWERAHLRLTIPDDGDCARAAALLGPTNPGRRGKVINFITARRGVGVGPHRIGELLRRIDRDGIDGELELVEAEAPGAPEAARAGDLAALWDDAVAKLPDDWSDALVEVELPSTDYIEPAALALSPLNPRRVGRFATFQFRAARTFGYGAAPEMVRRCLQRLDDNDLTGRLRVVDVFSDMHPVKTQGAVWYSGGRAV